MVHIVLPPLRERPEDIRPLVGHFIKKYLPERKANVPVGGVDKEVERLFFDYDWPGNVRELENVIERAMIMCPGETIRLTDLPPDFKDNAYNTLVSDGISSRPNSVRDAGHGGEKDD